MLSQINSYFAPICLRVSDFQFLDEEFDHRFWDGNFYYLQFLKILMRIVALCSNYPRTYGDVQQRFCSTASKINHFK